MVAGRGGGNRERRWEQGEEVGAGRGGGSRERRCEQGVMEVGAERMNCPPFHPSHKGQLPYH